MSKKLMVGALSAALLCGIGSYSMVRAADAPAKPAKTEKAEKPKDETIKGTVEVTKDDKGAVKDVELKSADGTSYVCQPAAQAKALEADAGKMVEVTGKVSDKDGKKTIHIKSINATPK